MIDRFFRRVTAAGLLAGTLLAASAAVGQNIRSHYVSKAEADGVIYHTFPVTLFEHPEAGDLTFDITYKEHRTGRATLNFTCRSEQAVAVDSVRFASGRTEMAGPVGKIYLEPENGALNTVIHSTSMLRFFADSSTKPSFPR